jgi:hypothetical protein
MDYLVQFLKADELGDGREGAELIVSSEAD